MTVFGGPLLLGGAARDSHHGRHTSSRRRSGSRRSPVTVQARAKPRSDRMRQGQRAASTVDERGKCTVCLVGASSCSPPPSSAGVSPASRFLCRCALAGRQPAVGPPAETRGTGPPWKAYVSLFSAVRNRRIRRIGRQNWQLTVPCGGNRRRSVCFRAAEQICSVRRNRDRVCVTCKRVQFCLHAPRQIPRSAPSRGPVKLEMSTHVKWRNRSGPAPQPRRAVCGTNSSR